MIKPERLDRSVTFSGVEFVDVPALGKKDFKLNFYSYKEGTYSAKVRIYLRDFKELAGVFTFVGTIYAFFLVVLQVVFQNETSKEYQYYHVQVKSPPPGIMDVIKLSVQVRQSVSSAVTIDNVFPTPINVTTHVNVPEITLPNSFIIGAESQVCWWMYTHAT